MISDPTQKAFRSICLVFFFFVQSYPTKFCQKSINRLGLDGACPTQRAVASFESPLVRPSFHCPAVFEACPILQKKKKKHAIIIVDFCLWKKKQFSVRCFNIMFPRSCYCNPCFLFISVHLLCLSFMKQKTTNTVQTPDHNATTLRQRTQNSWNVCERKRIKPPPAARQANTFWNSSPVLFTHAKARL